MLVIRVAHSYELGPADADGAGCPGGAGTVTVKAVASQSGLQGRPADECDRNRALLAPDPSVMGPSPFTPREKQVADLLCRGLAARAIAAELDISYGTVRCHIQNIREKLGAHTALAAVIALSKGKEQIVQQLTVSKDGDQYVSELRTTLDPAAQPLVKELRFDSLGALWRHLGHWFLTTARAAELIDAGALSAEDILGL